MAAEPERVGQGRTRRPRTGAAGDDVEVDLGVYLVEADRRRDHPRSMVRARATASREPAAPSEWPVMPLIEVTAGPGEPNTFTMAWLSARSLAGVEVPWALTWVIASGSSPASSKRKLHAGHGPRAPG